MCPGAGEGGVYCGSDEEVVQGNLLDLNINKHNIISGFKPRMPLIKIDNINTLLYKIFSIKNYKYQDL